MRIGIFGGTFDPPHIGHMNMARTALEECGLDRIYFIPNRTPAYKMVMHEVSDSEHRYEMLKLMVSDCSWGEISDIELRREGNTYTSDTLAELCKLMPENEWFLIIGSDSLKELKTWHEPDKIFNLCTVICLLRDEDSMESMNLLCDEYKLSYNANIMLVNNAKVDISSSELRQMVADNQDISEWVTNTVREYIDNNKLYSV